MPGENNQGAVAEGTPAGQQAGAAGAVAGQDDGRGAGGEGAVQPQPKTYAGFQTPEELEAEYSRVKKEAEELTSLKGRFGNELGNLRAEKARLEGILQGIQTARPAGPSVTLADLDAKLQANDITLPEYLRQRDAIRDRETEQKLEKKFGGFKSEYEQEKYADQFIKDNPGYLDAFTKGLLAEWFDRGYSGEEAWTQYQLRQTAIERDVFKKQLEEKTNQAREEGIRAGTKIEQGKAPAGKVLGDGAGGSFSQAGIGPKPLRTHSERVAAGVELIGKVQ